MSNIFMMNKEIARGMVCFFHQKKHSYLILRCGLFGQEKSGNPALYDVIEVR
jgi:hypothetical protein